MARPTSVPWSAGAILVLGVLALGLFACESAPPGISGMSVDSAFTAAVIPVLRKQCEDCHFPGGPMYLVMPFDDIRVVSELEDELTVRLEGSGRELVAEWLDMMRAERFGAAPDTPSTPWSASPALADTAGQP